MLQHFFGKDVIASEQAAIGPAVADLNRIVGQQFLSLLDFDSLESLAIEVVDSLSLGVVRIGEVSTSPNSLVQQVLSISMAEQVLDLDTVGWVLVRCNQRLNRSAPLASPVNEGGLEVDDPLLVDLKVREVILHVDNRQCMELVEDSVHLVSRDQGMFEQHLQTPVKGQAHHADG